MSRRSTCRVCGKAIAPFMTFGRMPLANGFMHPAGSGGTFVYELTPAVCEACGTFQLIEQPPPGRMFHADYPFFTGTSSRMREHFRELAIDARRRIGGATARAVEVGSNDGTLLAYLAAEGFVACGVEPSANVAAVARAKGLDVVDGFFTPAAAQSLRDAGGPVDLVVGANVICHIADIHGVMQAVDVLLSPSGLFIFEEPFLGDMLDLCAYDQIYDEHVFMWSATAIAHLVSAHGFVLVDVQHQPTHGGSLRYVVARHGSRAPAASVAQQLDAERLAGLGDPERYVRFRRDCEAARDELVDALRRLRADGRRVAGYAATSKSTTVLNYAGIGPELIAYIADSTPAKHGTTTPGTHIPVVPVEHFHRRPPDCAVLFAWNHAAEIYAKERAFVDGGGKWITFVPTVSMHG